MWLRSSEKKKKRKEKRKGKRGGERTRDGQLTAAVRAHLYQGVTPPTNLYICTGWDTRYKCNSSFVLDALYQLDTRYKWGLLPTGTNARFFSSGWSFLRGTKWLKYFLIAINITLRANEFYDICIPIYQTLVWYLKHFKLDCEFVNLEGLIRSG
jgi:hypothetical protein